MTCRHGITALAERILHECTQCRDEAILELRSRDRLSPVLDELLDELDAIDDLPDDAA